MHKVNLEGVLQIVFHVLEEMELGWHVVALVPVGFPLAEDWESWFDLEEDVVIVSLGIR